MLLHLFFTPSKTCLWFLENITIIFPTDRNVFQKGQHTSLPPVFGLQNTKVGCILVAFRSVGSVVCNCWPYYQDGTGTDRFLQIAGRIYPTGAERCELALLSRPCRQKSRDLASGQVVAAYRKRGKPIHLVCRGVQPADAIF